MMRRRLFLLALLGLCACARESAPARWIAELQRADRLAEEAMERGDRGAARGALLAVLEKEVPPGVQADDARSVKKDICFRLALLELETGGPKEALAFAEQGLGLGEQEDLFTANLLVAKGRALEALGREADAAESYHRALKINQLLLQRELEAEGAGP